MTESAKPVAIKLQIRRNDMYEKCGLKLTCFVATAYYLCFFVLNLFAILISVSHFVIFCFISL